MRRKARIWIRRCSMAKSINFIKNGHDSFIDFIKAYAIICVLIGHTLPAHGIWGYSLWAGMQVPLFILIQVFHGYKQNNLNINFQRIIIRVLLPYLITQVIIFIVYNKVLLRGGVNLFNYFIMGGKGPGSYYPWIYIQIAILIPLLSKSYKKNNNVLLIIFVIVCECLEIFCSIYKIPDGIYRLLAIRYFFLIYLGREWVDKGIIINKKMFLLSIISLCSIIYFSYFSFNNEPWFFNTAWRYHRWPCYYYVANLLVLMLNLLWNKIKNIRLLCIIIKNLASSTYEIYLAQMAIIYLFKYNSLKFINNIYIQYVIWFFIVWFISLSMGIVTHKYVINRFIQHVH